MEEPNVNQVSVPETPDSNIHKESAGPVIGIIVLLAIIVLGGIYFWSQRPSNTTDSAQEEVVPVDTASIETQSASDDTSSIEADLNATDLDNLDSEFDNL